MNQLGILINLERKKQNMSQAALCEGICSVSYLSKIENLEVDPPDDLLRLLVDALNLKYVSYGETELFDLEVRINDILNDYYCFIPGSAHDKISSLLLQNDIENELSILSFDFSLLNILKKNIEGNLHSEDLSMYRIYFENLNQRQQYLLDTLSLELKYNEDDTLRDLSSFTDDKGPISLRISYIYFKNGFYRDALSYSKKAYALFVEEGNLNGMVQSSLVSCSSYSNVGETEKHLIEAKKILNLNRTLQDLVTEVDINYNIGATYLVQKEFTKALYYLNRGYQFIDHKPQMDLLFLEKIGFIHAFKHDPIALKPINDLLLKNHNAITIIKILTTICYDVHYAKNIELMEDIETLLDNDEKLFHGRYHMYSGLLYICYKAHYKYSKCLEILEEFGHEKSLPFV